MTDQPRLTLPEEALLKVGKNVLNLQKLEGMLKTLVTLSNVGGDSQSLVESHESRKVTMSNKTMGAIFGEYVDTVYLGDVEPEVGSDDEISMSSTFRIEADSEDIESTQASFSRLIEGRNHLVHHRLLDFDIQSDESCRQLIAELDQQHKEIAPLYEVIQQQLNTLIEMQRETITVLQNRVKGHPTDDA